MQRQGRGAGGGGDDDMPPPPPLDSDDDEPPPPPPPPDSDDDDAPPPPPADWEDSDDGMPPPPPDDSDDEAFIPPPPAHDYGDDFGAEPPPPAWDEHDAACAEEAYAEMPEDGQLAELQLTADSKAGFGLSMDNYMAVPNVTGPAARAGWQRGWVVLAVQGRPVSDQQQLVQELTRAGKSARFTVQIPRSDDLFNDYARPGTAAAAGAGAVDPTAADDFYRQDADRSGELDRAEVLQLLQERGIDMQPSYVDGFWDSVDRSGNGTLDMGEYLALLQMLESPSGAAQLRADQQRAVQQEQEQERQEQEGAAVVLQTRFRGHAARTNYKEQKSAKAIQSRYRGHSSRKKLKASREKEAVRQKAWEAYNKAGPSKKGATRSVRYTAADAAGPEHSTRERADAATKLQASFRGRQGRKKIKTGPPPPGQQRKQRMAQRREQLRHHAPMHQSFLQQMQHTARQLEEELQEGGFGLEMQASPRTSGAAAAAGAPKSVEWLMQRNKELESRLQQLEGSSAGGRPSQPLPLSPRRSSPSAAAEACQTLAAAMERQTVDDGRYWREAWDSRYNRRYYWHKKTNEVRWDAPEGFARSRSKTSTSALMPRQLPKAAAGGELRLLDRSSGSRSGRHFSRSRSHSGSHVHDQHERSGSVSSHNRPTVPGSTVVYVPS